MIDGDDDDVTYVWWPSLFFARSLFVGFLVLALVFIYDVASKRFSSKSLFFSRQQQKEEKKNVTKMWQK